MTKTIDWACVVELYGWTFRNDKRFDPAPRSGVVTLHKRASTAPSGRRRPYGHGMPWAARMVTLRELWLIPCLLGHQVLHL